MAMANTLGTLPFQSYFLSLPSLLAGWLLFCRFSSAILITHVCVYVIVTPCGIQLQSPDWEVEAWAFSVNWLDEMATVGGGSLMSLLHLPTYNCNALNQSIAVVIDQISRCQISIIFNWELWDIQTRRQIEFCSPWREINQITWCYDWELLNHCKLLTIDCI